MDVSEVTKNMTPENKESVAQLYTETNELLSTISPGASIEPAMHATTPCNIVKTPNKTVITFSVNTIQMLRAVFGSMFPHLRGEDVLVDAIEFAEKYSDSYFKLVHLNSRNNTLIGTISEYRNAISRAPNDTSLHEMYKEMIRRVKILVEQASPEAKLQVLSQNDTSSTVIHTPSTTLLCDHLAEIVSMLIVFHPANEEDLILCLNLASEFGEMLGELNLLAYRKKETFLQRRIPNTYN